MRTIATTFASHHLEAAVEAIRALPVRGQMSASQVLFADGTASHTQEYRGATYRVPWQRRTELEIVVEEDDADPVLEALLHVLDKESAVDELVRISSIEEAVCMRTGKPDAYPETSWMPLEG
jgi:nitrogen regulatory protein P-II 1